MIHLNDSPVHVLLCYKNFAIHANVSHIGLGVAGVNNAKVLQKHGVRASVEPIVNANDLRNKLLGMPSVTHVVISAPWVPTVELAAILREFSRIQFTVNCHSNVAFLQADTNGVKLMREYIELERATLNFSVAGNSRKFVHWVREAMDTTCDYLPNMYYLDYSVASVQNQAIYKGGVLRIGAFGATRPQKNLMSAAGAALELSADLKTDVEFWVSGGRTEGGGNTILNAVRQLLNNQPGITLKELSWASWPQFRAIVRRMHLLIQVSTTESFNMVTADGVAEGVPSIVSEAIDWAPPYWMAHIDDVSDMARIGRQLIFDPQAHSDGLQHLEKHNAESFDAWLKYLGLYKGIVYKPIIKNPYL